jgi:hypothetical protein
MTENRPLADWLRSLAGCVGLAGMLGLTACGGGSGAPFNVFNPPPTAVPLTVLPSSSIAYSGIPTTITVSGGTAPYKAFSSNSTVLPVTQTVAGSTVVLLAGNVAADTPVTVTVQDSSGQAATAAGVPATVTVRAAPLVNSLTITPNLADCGTSAICSGQNGTASVTVLGPEGGVIAGRLVRFDVVAGPYGITTTNPAQPIVASLTVASGANGVASVIVKANVDAPTQFSQLRVTDLTSGQQLIGNFLIQQVTDGSKILTVVPATATITAFYKDECSTGFITDYYIYGGTPPYRVTSTFPASVILVNSTVNAAGGFFEAITNGACVNPLTFSVLDATGRQTTSTLINNPGTNDRPVVTPVVAPALSISPGSVAATGCLGKTFAFIAAGGTPSYGAIVTPTFPVTVSGNTVTVSGLPAGAGSYAVTVFDQTTPQKTATATITCS